MFQYWNVRVDNRCVGKRSVANLYCTKTYTIMYTNTDTYTDTNTDTKTDTNTDTNTVANRYTNIGLLSTPPRGPPVG